MKALPALFFQPWFVQNCVSSGVPLSFTLDLHLIPASPAFTSPPWLGEISLANCPFPLLFLGVLPWPSACAFPLSTRQLPERAQAPGGGSSRLCSAWPPLAK